jgi:hypothetical protein
MARRFDASGPCSSVNIPPAVVHIPHASTAIPEEIRRTLPLSQEDLDSEFWPFDGREVRQGRSVTRKVQRMVVSAKKSSLGIPALGFQPCDYVFQRAKRDAQAA